MIIETPLLSVIIIIVMKSSSHFIYHGIPDFGNLVQILLLETSNRNIIIVDFKAHHTKSNVDFLTSTTSRTRVMKGHYVGRFYDDFLQYINS